MARRDVGYPSSWVVSVAAILTVLPAASWIVAFVWSVVLGTRQVGAAAWHLLLSHPLGLVLALAPGAVMTGVSLVSAWLLEEDRWLGAAVAIGMFLFRGLAAGMRSRGRVSFALLLALVSLGFAIQALRLLRRYRSAPSETDLTPRSAGGERTASAH